MTHLLRNFLNGRPHPDAPPIVARALTRLARFLRRCLLGESPRTDPPGENNRPPDAGKPAPVSPSPTHHLVAAKSLPPGDAVHVFPAD